MLLFNRDDNLDWHQSTARRVVTLKNGDAFLGEGYAGRTETSGVFKAAFRAFRTVTKRRV